MWYSMGWAEGFILAQVLAEKWIRLEFVYVTMLDAEVLSYRWGIEFLKS